MRIASGCKSGGANKQFINNWSYDAPSVDCFLTVLMMSGDSRMTTVSAASETGAIGVRSAKS